MDHPLDLFASTDQRIDLAVFCLLIQIRGVTLKWAGLPLLIALSGFTRFTIDRLLLPVLSHAMGNIINDINPFDILVSKQVDRMAFALSEERHQQMGTGDFFFPR